MADSTELSQGESAEPAAPSQPAGTAVPPSRGANAPLAERAAVPSNGGDAAEVRELDSALEPAVLEPLAGIPAPLAAAMRQRGFEELTSVQQAVLAAESEGRDLRISSQTGSGKTVAIGLALASHLTEVAPAGKGKGKAKRGGPSVLVLVPTRELAMQVRDELCWLFAGTHGLSLEVVMGGTSLGLERRALSSRPRVVVGTPGRTLDHLQTGALSCDQVAHLVLDESDRMLDMGFREELEAILERMPEERRTHLVSATFSAPVRKLADRFQRDPLHIEGTRLGAANRDIEHVVHTVERHDVHPALVNLLLLNEGARCLVFVERRIDASALADKLSGDGFAVQCFSGELAQTQRTRTLAAFRDGTIKTLIATDVAARGIDVPDIELVVHVERPDNADTYIHRSGRTGRAGRTGRSVMLVPPRARRQTERMLSFARIQADWQPVPNAGKVRKQLRKRFRREMHQQLDAEAAPTQAQMDYAKSLLDGRDPAAVVARLVDMAQPRPSREPMDLRSEQAHDARPQHGEAAQGFVRFTINWGASGGAAANRLLGHICRRGQIRGHLVGEIEIGPDASTFDVAASVAARFEKKVKRTDPRDPKLHIRRLGGAPSGDGPPRGPRRAKPRPKKRFKG